MKKKISSVNDQSARKNVAVLIAAQAILGSQMPMVFVVGGLAGGMLADNICFATLPISLIVFGSMTTAPWLSPFMQRHGRKAGFYAGAVGGALGAAIAGYGLYISSFPLLLLGSYFTGVYLSAQSFFRFAATDRASDQFKPKAISYVMAGGLLSALLGPQLNKLAGDATLWPVLGPELLPTPFLGTYMAIVLLNIVGMVLFPLLDLPSEVKRDTIQADAPPPRTWAKLLQDPVIFVAIICAMVSYALMNLVMTSTPLAVVACGFTTDNANDVVSAHVIAMYLPSFFTGHLIARFGAYKIIATGLALLAVAGGVALSGIQLSNFFSALILLGLGWNFGFIGATSLLTTAYMPHERGRAQGLNDMMVYGCVTLASLASGGLMNCVNGAQEATASAGWNAVNIAMIPFLMAAAGALLWLYAKRQKQVLP